MNSIEMYLQLKFQFILIKDEKNSKQGMQGSK